MRAPERDPRLTSFAGLGGRVGIFGGTFDPVHRAHIEIARIAERVRSLERVVFLPAASSPHKPRGALASSADRLQMLLLALRCEPNLFVSSLELERPAPSFTRDTLRAIRAEVAPGAQLFFILGSDCLPALPRWKALEEIFALAQLVVIERGGFGESDLDSLRVEMNPEQIERLREAFVAGEPIEISSSELRARLRAGSPPSGQLHPDVLAFIRVRRLYR